MNKKIIGQLGYFLLFFILFGYPIQAFIPFVFNLYTKPINFGFRIAILILAVFLIIVTSFNRTENTKFKKDWIFFITFWLIYSVRIIYDCEVKGLIYLKETSFFVYSFAFGVSLIPSIAIYKSLPFYNLKKSLTLLIGLLLVSNICLLYAVLSTSNWNISEVLAGRANVRIELEGDSVSIVNPITVGYIGQSLAIVAIRFLSILKNQKLVTRLFFLACTSLGVLNLILGASRGPLLGFILLFVVEFFLLLKNATNKRMLILKVIPLSLIIFYFVFSQFLLKAKTGDVELVNRTYSFYESRQDGESEERDYEFLSAWEQFKDNPILGDAFVTKFDNSYSHNILLDVLMATGILGAFIFTGLLHSIYLKLRIITQNLKSNPSQSFLYVLFLGSFIISLTSGGLFMSSNFWLLTAAILALK